MNALNIALQQNQTIETQLSLPYELKEKFALKILTKNYSEKEYVKRKKIENLEAVKYTLNRPITNLKKFINNNLSSKKILIVGTLKHKVT
jgi:hypothetical protein